MQDLANTYNEMGRAKDAADLLSSYLKKDISSFAKVSLTTQLAQFYADRDQLGKAIAVLEDLEDDCENWTRNDCIPTMDLLAKYYERFGDESKAEDVYRLIVKNFPDTQYAEDAKKNL